MDQQTIAAIVPGAMALVAVIVALVANMRISTARRSLKLLQASYDGKTLVDAVAGYAREVKATQQHLETLGRRHEELAALLALSSRNIGLVRFDAFEEMGGRLSFSAAFLNDHGTGVVLTSINGRSESRVYAKEVVEGASEHTLSPEEVQAIGNALGRRRRARASR